MRNLREDNDLTQKEVAALLGTSQTMYARYERGANEMPIRHLIQLAKYYNVTTDYLLGLTDQKTRASRHRDGKKAKVPIPIATSEQMYQNH